MPRKRAAERGHDELGRVRARLGVFCICDAQDLTCVLDQYVLKAASSADKRKAALARCRDSAQRPAHAPIGAGWRNPQTRVPALQVERRWYLISGHPLPTGARMAETVV